MSGRTKQQIQEHEEARQQAAQQRHDQVMNADYSAATNFDELYGDLATAEIKALYSQNATFKAKVDELNNAPLPQTTTLGPSQDEIDAARAAEAQAASPEPVTQTDAATPEAVSASQAEADRLVAEAAAAGTPLTVQRDAVEILYDGVEKLGEGSYKLTVDPEDGTNPEIFYGSTQADCFKKLRKSKAHATKELRRRAKKVQITNELKALEAEVIDYAPYMQPVTLTPDEIFTLTEQLKDPLTVLEATRKLREASYTPEECARHNEGLDRARRENARNVAYAWLLENQDRFYNCPENIEAMQKLMGDLNWAVTPKNMDLAFENLVEQGVLLDRPEETSNQPVVAQPASVVPVAAAAVTQAPAAPAAVAPKTAPTQTATTGVLPAAPKVLRPGSSTAVLPTRRSDSVPVATVPTLTVEEYNNMPAAVMKMRYNRDKNFAAQVDALIASGKV